MNNRSNTRLLRSENRGQIAEIIHAQVHVEVPVCSVIVIVHKSRAASCRNPDAIDMRLSEPFSQCKLRIH